MSVKNIRIISQKEFDGMVSGQQAFFLKLVENGQAKISETTSSQVIVETDATAPKSRVQSPTHRYLNKPVMVELINEKTIVGELTEVWQYELVITRKNGNQVTVFKSNILTMEGIVGV